MSQDSPSGRARWLTGPADALAAVVPDDAADLPGGVCRSLFVGEAGVVVVDDPQGATVAILSGASQYHPIRVRRVRAAGTTASGVIAIY
jgi:hypothetical protein